MTKKRYSTSLTGAGFRLFEFKQVVQLIEDGFSDDEIRTKVYEENLFQQKKSSTERSFIYILQRAKILDGTLRQWILEEPNDIIKLINFYAIMKTDLLFYEFMKEVIYEKLLNNNFIYEKKDINIFFNNKAEENEEIANWSASTTKRLKSSYNRLLIEIGYIDNMKAMNLNKLFIDDYVKEHLIKIGDRKYVEVLEG